MRCANCARDIPAGARYCVHCGAEQSMPTPIAAVAAAIAQRGNRAVPHAANAAHAEPAANDTPRAALAAPRSDPRPLRGPPQADVVAHPRASGRPEGVPAYASAPRRMGVALTLLAACFALAAVGFFAWRMVEPPATGRDAANETEGSIMSSFPPEETPQKQQRAAAAPQTSPTSAPQAAQVPADATPTTNRPQLESPGGSATVNEKGAASAAAAPPVEITPLPARPAAPRASRRSPEREARAEVRAQASPAPATPPAPAAPQASSAPPIAVAAAPKAPARTTDRFARLREEIAACTREDFIARVVCSQQARFRHCGGYWGTVPECPGNPTPDHGQ